MSLTTIAIAIAVVVFVLARRVRGEAVPTPKKLFILPIVAGIIGVQSLLHTRLNAVDIGVIATGSALSLGLGALRGRSNKLSVVNGSPWVSWGAASVALFAVNVLAKLALDGVGLAAGGTAAALGNSILLSLGLTLLGEAAVVWLRSQTLVSGGAPTGGQYRGTVQPSGRSPIR